MRLWRDRLQDTKLRLEFARNYVKEIERPRQLRERVDAAQRQFEEESRIARLHFEVLFSSEGAQREAFIAWRVQSKRLIQAIREYREEVSAYIADLSS